MSAIGTKRTSACALHMSAFYPKRTFRKRRGILADVSPHVVQKHNCRRDKQR